MLRELVEIVAMLAFMGAVLVWCGVLTGSI